jgi:ELWxxDGT repeat protein
MKFGTVVGRGAKRVKQQQRRPLRVETLEERRLLSVVPLLVDDLTSAGLPLTAGGNSFQSELFTEAGGTDEILAVGENIFFRSRYLFEQNQLYSVGAYDVPTVPSPISAGGGFQPTAIGPNVYFYEEVAGDTTLWQSDGSAASTAEVLDIDDNFSFDTQSAAVGGKLVFVNADAERGAELWILDPEGDPPTGPFLELRPGQDSSNPHFHGVVGDQLFFTAQTGDDNFGLWVTDGTQATEIMVDVVPAVGFDNFRQWNGEIVFLEQIGDGSSAPDVLWATDGTAGNTRRIDVPTLIDDGSTAGVANQSSLLVVGDDIYYPAKASEADGFELWKISTKIWKPNGIEFSQVTNENFQQGPANLTLVRNRLFFTATTDDVGNELWLLDLQDSSAAATLAVDINTAPGGGSDPFWLTSFDQKLFFVADDRTGNEAEPGAAGRELHYYDWADSTHGVVDEIRPGQDGAGAPESAFPRSLIDAGGHLFFTADDGTHGRELWVGIPDGPDIAVEIDSFNPIVHREGLIDFGSVGVGDTSEPQELTIKNTGGEPLILFAPLPVQIQGPDPDQFDYEAPPSGEWTLGPGDSTTFTLTFAPDAIGEFTAQVVLSHNDPNEYPYRFYVKGMGIDVPDFEGDISVHGEGQEIVNLDLAPDVADGTDYGDVLLGEVNVHTFSIINTGNDVLSLSGMEPVSVDGLNPGDFTVTSQPALDVLNPDEATNFDIEFDPLAAGQRVAAVTIHSDDPDEASYFFAIVGVGQVHGPSPDIRVLGNGLTVVHGDVEPSTDDGTAFTDALPGQSVVRTFAIENTGDAALNFVGDTPIVITGANPDDFSITLQPPASLEPGQTTTFEVQFNPTTFGVRLATVYIGNDDPDESPFQFDVQGQVNLVATSDWVSQGPGPASNGLVENILPNDPISGAVHTVLAHPTNPNILYLGAVNGGIWKTTNATSPTLQWQPQTDLQSSLSIGAMAFDSSDPTVSTLVAGIGRFSNFGNFGGERTGILLTRDGGNTWTNPGSEGLEGINISGIAAQRDEVVVTSNLGGMYKSTDGGKHFVAISGDDFGIDDLFFDLVHDPGSGALYAAAAGKGIFQSDDFGTSWAKISSGGVDTKAADLFANNIELAVHQKSGRLYAAVLIGGKLIGIPDGEGGFLVEPGGVYYYGEDPVAADGSKIWAEVGPVDYPFPMLPLNPPRLMTDVQPTVVDDEPAAPIVITAPGHGLMTGDIILIENEPAMASQADGLWRVEVVDGSSFALPDSCPFVDCMAEELELAEPAFDAENSGQWSKMEDTNPTPQWRSHIPFSIAVAPNDETMVYVGGERQESPLPNRIGAEKFTGAIFRGIADGMAPGEMPFLPLQWSPITHKTAEAPLRFDNDSGTATHTAPPAGSREMAFDALGSLIEVDDGGIYKRTSPEGKFGDWVSLIGDLQVSEIHNVAYDTVSNTIISGTQGAGTQYQFTPDQTAWVTLTTQDAGDVAVDTLSLADQKQSVRYTVDYGFRLRKTTWDKEGNWRQTHYPRMDNLPGSPPLEWRHLTPVQLNNVNPLRMVIGGANGLYESFDQGETVSRILPGLTTTASYYGNPLDYGGRKDGVDNKDVIYAGDAAGNIWIRKQLFGNLTFVSSQPPGGDPIRDVIMNTEDYTNAFAMTDSRVFSTNDMGENWDDITGDLFQLIDSTGVKVANLLSLEFMSGLNDSAVVVGTNIGVFASLLSNPDHRWFELGAGLPNTPVWDLDFDPADDVTVVGTLGRGAWKLTGVGQDIGVSINELRVTSLLDELTGEHDGSFADMPTLREAINQSNLRVGKQVITIDPSFDGQTLDLSQGELVITDSVEIDVSALDSFTIRAGDSTPEDKIGDGQRIFTINNGDDQVDIEVMIRGLTLSGGDVDGEGGAVRNRENLILDNVIFINNHATQIGGALSHRQGALTVTNSWFEGNSNGSGHGGAIAVWNANQDVLIQNTSIHDNFSLGDGGGLDFLGGGGQIVVDRVTLSNNEATDRGGGIWAYRPITITSSTISGNSVGEEGGGIWTNEQMDIDHSTILQNQSLGSGGGIYAAASDQSVNISHTIVAQNTSLSSGAPDVGVDVGRPAMALFSLIGNNTGSGFSVASVTGSSADGNFIGNPYVGGIIDPQLGPLEDNGGPTLTHAPLVTSPVVDAGDPAALSGVEGIPEFDQRGDGAFRVVDGTDSGVWRIDMGAVELNPVLTGDFNGDDSVDAADYSVWRDTLGSTTDLRADTNGDGVVDDEDYKYWKQNFGATAVVTTSAVATSSALAQVTVNADVSAPLPAMTTAVAMAIIDEPVVAAITQEEPESQARPDDLAFAFALLGEQAAELGQGGVVLSSAGEASEPAASLLLLAVNQSRSSAAFDPDPWSIDQEAEDDESTTALLTALAVEDLFGGIDG